MQNLHKQIMLSMFKYQIFRFWSKFGSFTQLSIQRVKFNTLSQKKTKKKEERKRKYNLLKSS